MTKMSYGNLNVTLLSYQQGKGEKRMVEYTCGILEGNFIVGTIQIFLIGKRKIGDIIMNKGKPYKVLRTEGKAF